MSSLPEALLARLTTPDRAAAIYGDIIELAATRSRLWFWTTYVRALISLGWRTPAAFVVGFACLILLPLYLPKLILFRLWVYHPHLVQFGRNASPHPYIFLSAHPHIQEAVSRSMSQFWFLVPFAAVRYGFEDRLARLGLAALLMTTGMMLSLPLLSPLFFAAGIITISASLASINWRRPAIELITATVVGGITLLNLGFLAHMACWIYAHKPLNASSHHHFFEGGFAFPRPLFWVVIWTMEILNMLVLAFVCSRMHKPLPRQRVTIA